MLMSSSSSITDGSLDIVAVEAVLRAAIGSAARPEATTSEAYDTTYMEGEAGIDPNLSLLNQASGEQLDNMSPASVQT